MTVSGTAVVSCANHPSREALGICVACKKRICAECVTRVDGINYCVACLEGLSRARASVPPGPAESAAGSGGALVRAVGGWVVLSGLVTLLLEALLRG